MSDDHRERRSSDRTIVRSRALHAAAVAEELARNLRSAVERDRLDEHGLVEPLEVAGGALRQELDDIKRRITTVDEFLRPVAPHECGSDTARALVEVSPCRRPADHTPSWQHRGVDRQGEAVRWAHDTAPNQPTQTGATDAP